MWDSILLVLLVALALVGLWHLAALTCGYKVLPMYQRSACGSQVHQLAYITEHERHQLMAAGGSGKAQPGTQGVPCYPKILGGGGLKRKRTSRGYASRQRSDILSTIGGVKRIFLLHVLLSRRNSRQRNCAPCREKPFAR